MSVDDSNTIIKNIIVLETSIAKSYNNVNAKLFSSNTFISVCNEMIMYLRKVSSQSLIDELYKISKLINDIDVDDMKELDTVVKCILSVSEKIKDTYSCYIYRKEVENHFTFLEETTVVDYKPLYDLLISDVLKDGMFKFNCKHPTNNPHLTQVHEGYITTDNGKTYNCAFTLPSKIKNKEILVLYNTKKFIDDGNNNKLYPIFIDLVNKK